MQASINNWFDTFHHWLIINGNTSKNQILHDGWLNALNINVNSEVTIAASAEDNLRHLIELSLYDLWHVSHTEWILKRMSLICISDGLV